MGNSVLTPYEKVQLVRDSKRPVITDYIDALFTDFVEMKGDRLRKEDASILGGIAYFHRKPVTIIGHRKGRSLEDNMKYNFGMPGPEGYRKAMRLMKQAEKFRRPIITFIDTPGAFPGIEAETNGQSIAIAENLAKMSQISVPIISIITGEGSSGGALAIGVADRVWMLENAVYSILSPEGFAAIMWKDSTKVREACETMKMTAEELYAYGLIDGIIPEGKKGIQNAGVRGFSAINKMLVSEINKLTKLRSSALVEQRYQKYRNIDGKYCPS
jgi:acetyl-CoA carboxylase carboxyl transferase alpha subunit